MTNEEKAQEISLQWWSDCGWQLQAAAYDAAIEAMAWKQQQLVDKCKEFCNKQTIGEYYNKRGVFQIDKYIDDMLNFIKGE